MRAIYTILLLPTFAGIGPADAIPSNSHRLTLEDLVSVEPIGETALSPDGRTVAMVRAGQIALLPAEGGWPVTLTISTGGKSGLSWSPDGRKLAFASQGSIWTVPVAGGQPKRSTRATGRRRSETGRRPWAAMVAEGEMDSV